MHKNFWASKLTMNDEFPVVLDSCMRQFGIFRSTCQGLSMVCWSRVEVKNGLGHISAVENLEKWKKKLSNSSTKVTMVSACFSFFFSSFMKMHFHIPMLLPSMCSCHKSNRHLFKVKCRYFDTKLQLLILRKKAFRINADFGFMFDWVSKCTKCKKKSKGGKHCVQVYKIKTHLTFSLIEKLCIPPPSDGSWRSGSITSTL